LRASVDGPADAVGFEDEGADIHVAVGNGRFAAFDRDVDGAGVGPRAAVDRDGHGALAFPVQRRRGSGKRGECGVPPEEREREVAGAGVGTGRQFGGGGEFAEVVEFPTDRGRLAEAAGEPEEGGLEAAVRGGVGVVEGVAAGRGDLVQVVGRGEEAGKFVEAAAVAEGALERGEHGDVKRGAIGPIHRALGVNAIGGVGFGGGVEFVDGALDGALREGGLAVGDGEGTDDESAVADLVPVVAAAHPREKFGGRVERGAQAFFDEGGGEGVAFGGREGVVEPVVADGDGERGFGGVEEDGGIPVGERGEQPYLGEGAVAETGVAGETCGGGEGEDTALNLARGLKDRAGESAAFALSDDDGRKSEDGFGAGADEGEEAGGDQVGGGG
jgi:hypothetical protein